MSNLFLHGIPVSAVVQTGSFASTMTAVGTTSSSFVSTGVTVTLTPKFSTSKFFIMATGNLGGVRGFATIARNSSSILGSNGPVCTAGAAANYWMPVSMVALDVTGSTSPVTYSIMIRSDSGQCTFGSFSTVVLTVLEIQS